jgi:hypothetical protein
MEHKMKYVKQLNNDELLERLADDLATMHLEGGIDLGYWETAFEVVSRYYRTSIKADINGKKEQTHGA